MTTDPIVALLDIVGHLESLLLHEANTIIATNTKEVGGRLADIHSTFVGNETTYLTQVIEPSLEGAKQIASLFCAAR